MQKSLQAYLCAIKNIDREKCDKIEVNSSVVKILSDVIFPNFDFSIYEICLQRPFFDLLRNVVNEADDKQFDHLVDETYKVFSTILRRAFVDIWVFLAPSAENFHCALIEFLQFFRDIRIENKALHKEKQQKLVADCTKLCEITLDAMQSFSTSSNFQIRRGSRIISLAVLNIFLHDNTKIPKLFQFFTENIEKSSNPLPILSLIRVMIDESSIQIFEEEEEFFDGENITKEETSSEEICSVVAGPPETNVYRRNSKCFEDMLIFALKILDTLTKIHSKIDENLDYSLRQIALSLYPTNVPRNSSNFNEINSMLLKIYKQIHSKKLTKKTKMAFFKLLMHLLQFLPTSKNLAEIFSLAYDDEDTLESMALALRNLFLECPLQPNESLIFPQLLLSDDELAAHPPRNSEIVPDSAGSFQIDPTHKIFLSEGLTVSFWLAMTEFEKIQENRYQHVFSMGAKELFLQVEIASKTGAIILKIFEMGKIIWTQRLPRLIIHCDTWINITLGVSFSDGELDLLCLIGDRFITKNFQLDLELHETPFEIAIGTASTQDSTSKFSYEMSSIFAFKGVIPPQCAIILKSLGCECNCLTECLHSEIHSSFLNCLTKRLISSGNCTFMHAADGREPKKYLLKLQKSLMFILRASVAHSLQLSALQKGIDSDKLGKIRDAVLYLTVYKDSPVDWRCRLAYRQVSSIDISIRAIGSIKLFIFLYALSIDRAYSPEAQLEALRLLFTALKRSPGYYAEFNKLNGPFLLVQILSVKAAHMNYEIFEEIVNFCFSETERRHVSINSEITVTCRSVIVEPRFLRIFLTTIDLWKDERFQYWVRFIQLVCDSLLINPSRIYQWPFREFNLNQLLHCDLLLPLFHALLDMMQNRENFSSLPNPKNLDETLTKALKTIVRELLSSNSDHDCVTHLWHFLLLSHPAQDTYLDYSIKGHNDWICLETLIPGEEPSIQGHSALSKFFERVLLNFGKDHVAKLWRDTNSAVGVRKALYQDAQAPRIFSIITPSRLVSMACAPDDPQAGFCSQDHPLRIGENFTSIKNESVLEVNEDWLVKLRADLLEIICEVLITCEDSRMSIIENDLINWQTILVQLSNQSHSQTRNLIFRLLQNFLLRCSNKCRSSFINNQGFLLLANQLKKFRINFDIADALFSIFCGEAIKIQDGLDEEHLRSIQLDGFKQASFQALFSLLEESVHESGLFWTVCSTLHKIFDVNISMRSAMLDCGLIDVMANVLREVCVYQANYQSVIGPFFPLMDCWISFARLIVSSLVPYRSSRLYTKCEEFVWLCMLADWQHNNPELEIDESYSLANHGNCPQCTAQLLRKALCQILQAWIECIQVVLTDQFHSSSLIPADEVKGSSSDLSDFEVIYPESHYASTSYFGDETRRRRKQLGFAGHEEIASRLMFILNMANNLFVFLPLPETQSDSEESLFQYYLETLTATWKRRKNEKTADEWQTVLSYCRDKTRLLLAQLIAFVLFPVQLRLRPSEENFSEDVWLLNRRLAVVKLLSNELTNNKQTLISLLDVNLDYQYAMKIALHELALCPQRSGIAEEYDAELDRMIKFLRSIQIESPLSNLSRDEIDSLTTDEIILLHSYFDHRQKFCTQLQEQAGKLKQKEEAILKFTSEVAMALTCEIAEFQNVPRKIFIQNRKKTMNEGAIANETLAHLVKELCHPEAPFFDSASWPRGWALDTTENPRRERRRLRPQHYQFQTKFLQSHRRTEIDESMNILAPLQLLLQESQNHCTLDHVAANNHVRLSVSATLIRTVFECFGEIIISDQKLHFLGEKAKSTQKGQIYAPVNYSWTYEQISEIHNRFYLLKDTSLELFTLTGDAFLVVFETTEDRNSVLILLKSMNLGHLIADYNAQLPTVTQMWRRGSITNFDYLMTLNKLAGRSFNDLMQYPVFPFVLSDYVSTMIDLSLASSYRELSRPMAIQDKKMEHIYMHNYNSLMEENNRFKTHQNKYSSVRFGAYHYGSHYSNTGIVAHYLVRVSPYTNVALEYQDNNFDIPDRLFNSIETTWRLSSSESTTDFKELIPEFYFFPEMFQNREGLELGIRQGGQKADNVQLPAWCPRENYRLFCLIHRQALESPTVTANLHNWIDLIFGFKQTGDAAVKAINVFHPATYRGRDLEGESKDDELSLSAVRTMVRTYGQMPLQLFFSPHLPHMNVKNSGNATESHFLASVRGLRWGDFVGSPDIDAKTWAIPVVEFNFESNERIGHLFTINREGGGPCYGLPEHTHLLVKYKTDKRDPLRRNIDALNMAVISWRFSDNVLRIKLVKMDDSVWINLDDLQPFEISKVAFSPNNDLLCIGLSCGLIRVYSLVFQTETKNWEISMKSDFFAHTCTISSLKISDEHHVLVSASIDAKVCLWDINRLSYIRTLQIPPSTSENGTETVTLTCISSINCDVAVVLQSGHGSRVVLYTVNGDIVGIYKDELTITSITMTSLDEGGAINCLALGLETGVIRFLEMWTMTVIREIQCGDFHEPVISVEFGNDSKRLFAALASGRVLCWQVPNYFGSGKSKSPTFKLLNPFV